MVRKAGTEGPDVEGSVYQFEDGTSVSGGLSCT